MLILDRYQLDAGERFEPHAHDAHQLAWAATGVLRGEAVGATWVLPPTHALWLPGGVVHDVVACQPASMYCIYVEPEDFPRAWTDVTVAEVGPLERELLLFLAGSSAMGISTHTTPGSRIAPKDTRADAERLLLGLLRPADVNCFQVPMPTDDRARRVAEALVTRPWDDHSLPEWGRRVGASSRTLARLFRAETGSTFTDWRIQLRLFASLEFLAAGEPVTNVSMRVGYASPSAYVAAFRKQFGHTPTQHFVDKQESIR